MKILSPKTSFLGGALVSASHLGKLFPGDLIIFGDKSEFLDVNNVQYTSYEDHTIDSHSIWCNDTCLDGGYYSEQLENNMKLWEYLCNYDDIVLVNHQPISRCYSYLYSMLWYLQSNGVSRITLLNYRACWNEEFDNYLRIHFPNIVVGTLPYHYYLDDLNPYPMSKLRTEDIKICAIGRSKSKCKIQYALDKVQEVIGPVDSILPDPKVSNVEFMKKLSEYDIVLTGYYYGYEGDPEIDKPFNKLEWSLLDTILVGSMPVTSELFNSELYRLNLYLPTIDYFLKNFDSLKDNIGLTYVNYINNRDCYYNIIKAALEDGNILTRRIINRK